ncbi:MAG: methylated-DNA-protein-cysteine methyltransferase-like protein [Rhodothermales bacterium]|jgi:methylated-DNA-protein-cysteine methyltransferase-like protein
MSKKASPARSDFFDRVYEVVALIPSGKVTTYGLIARHLGLASSARVVGWALNGGSAAGLPCHRVVNRFGALSGRMHFGSPYIMEDVLKSEGVSFREDGTVDMDLHCWDPADPVAADPQATTSA